jgi:hypothetical protein
VVPLDCRLKLKCRINLSALVSNVRHEITDLLDLSFVGKGAVKRELAMHSESFPLSIEIRGAPVHNWLVISFSHDEMMTDGHTQ